MGKVHRIKRRLRKIMSQTPPPDGNYSIRYGVHLYTGKRYDGSRFLSLTAWGDAYKGLCKSLEREYTKSAG